VPIQRPFALVLDHSEREVPGETGSTLEQYAQQRGVHLSDALADWLLTNGMGSSMRTVVQPLDADLIVRLLRDPHTVTAVSDAGAHLQMFNGAGVATYMLSHWVRDTGLLGIEEVVHSVTGKLAGYFGLHGRGTVEVGRAADLCVFALDELSLQPDERVADVPGGSWRYTRRPGGFRYTVVNGQPTFADGSSTGAHPGALLAARSIEEAHR
jgi:N-acyl-D-aspartate/D-glutamate deacylase